MDDKETFLHIYDEAIAREGADKLRAYLLRSDFFEAPASIRYHSNVAGGLCAHSVNVYRRLLDLLQSERASAYPSEAALRETAAVCGLLHDVCKIGFYRPDFRNVKEDGQWVRKPCYVRDEAFPFGHGEKSVFIIGRYIHLTAEEAMAINWHMGGFDARARGGDRSVSEAFGKYPLAVLLHVADLEATYLDEKRG